MNTLVEQSTLLDTRPVVINNLNVSKPPAGEPTLLTYDELGPRFHEFGHALHGLFAAVTYPRFAGTNVPRDFVEFPSQVNEMWMLWPEVLANYARHYATGDAAAAGNRRQARRPRSFNEGFGTTEYLAAALLDLAWHDLDGTGIPDDARSSRPGAGGRRPGSQPVPPRYSRRYFAAHLRRRLYSAGYYSYVWSEVLDADTVEWFKENGGLTRANGDCFRAELLSRGNSRDPLESFRAFRGRDADLEPLLKRRGLD